MWSDDGTRSRWEERRRAYARLHERASMLADVSRQVARAFDRGGRLWVTGVAAHARHVAVEFMHPVIVGKRALPAAMSRDLGEASAGDIALAIGAGAEATEVLPALRQAKRRGALALALTDPDGAEASCDAAHHVLSAETDDRGIAHEIWVTQYHLLWELTHACLEAASAVHHPFQEAADAAAWLESMEASSRSKAAESASLRLSTLDALSGLLDECAASVAQRLRAGARLFVFGNGGSACDAQALETLCRASGAPASSLSDDAALLSALANDVGFQVVFARQLAARARPGDIALGLSTSGSSDNIIAAFEQAARMDMLTIGLSGYDGGRMADCGAIHKLLVVRSDSVHRIQEAQMTLYHVLWAWVQSHRAAGKAAPSGWVALALGDGELPGDDTVQLGGTEVRKGSRVRLRPRRHADAMDVLLAGRSALVEGVFRDVDEQTYVAVSIEDDPGRDLHRWYGRHYYYGCDEIEPIEEKKEGRT